MNRERGVDTTCKMERQRKAAVQHRELSSVLCDDLEGGMGQEGAQEGGDMCILMADSVLHTHYRMPIIKKQIVITSVEDVEK